METEKKQMKPYKEERPWGNFERFTHNETSTVKIIMVNAGERLSLQYHAKRSEFWKVLSGNPTVIVDGTVTVAQDGDEFFVPIGAKHRIQAGKAPARILEIALGEFDENDIVRLEDEYERV